MAPVIFETKNEQGRRGTVVSWASIIEQNTVEQAQMLSRALPVEGHVALMPDAHLGRGSTIGSVFQTAFSIMPAAVGVDIGCGMIAVQTDLHADLFDDQPEALTAVYRRIRQGIPAGVGGERSEPHPLWATFIADHPAPYRVANDADLFKRAASQFGTLGDGNHFVELSKDETGYLWVVLHSGSRGVGNILSTESQAIALEQCKGDGHMLEDPNLAWLVGGTTEFNQYVRHMLWAQDYAFAQRQAMMAVVLQALADEVGFFRTEEEINCHHNYAEPIGGSGKWLTRKGAIDAHAGRKGIIPGSMGEKTYIVEGVGNAMAYHSAPHGAGRLFSRGEARRSLSPSDFEDSMSGILWQDRDKEALLDEAPGAYKNIEAVIADSETLVKPIAVLTQIANYKGTVRRNRR